EQKGSGNTGPPFRSGRRVGSFPTPFAASRPAPHSRRALCYDFGIAGGCKFEQTPVVLYCEVYFARLFVVADFADREAIALVDREQFAFVGRRLPERERL